MSPEKPSTEEELPETPEGGEPLLRVVDENGHFRQERWDRLIQSIAQRSPRVSLPDSTLTREAMYSDHD